MTISKAISKKFTYKMDLYTLIEKLKDIQLRCENEGKDVELVIQNDFEEFHVRDVHTDNGIVFVDIKE